MRVPVIVLSVAALLVTQVRAGYIVFLVGVVFLSLKRFRRTASTLLATGAVAVLLVVAGLGAGAASQAVSDRLQSLNILQTTPAPAAG